MPLVLSGTAGVANPEGSAAAPAIAGPSADTGFYFYTTSIGVSTGGVFAAGFDSSQRFLRGYDTAVSTVTLSGVSTIPSVQTAGISQAASSVGIFNWSSAVSSAYLSFAKSKSGAIGSHSALTTNDDMGSINFAGSDGTDFVSSVSILAEVDATTGTGSMPGRLIVYTAAASATPVERIRINSSGLTVASLAGTGTRTVSATAAGLLTASSDSSLKQEVPDTELPGLAQVLRIQPKAYKWLSDIEARGEAAAVEIGFFADQVAPIIPSAAPRNSDGLFGFYDRAVVAALVKAVQELKAELDALKEVNK